MPRPESMPDTMENPALTERKSYRVQFTGGLDYALAGIIDRPVHDRDIRASVVFSHCFTCNKDLKAIVRISRALSSLGIAVLRFDMTGLGGSDGDFSQTNFTTNLQDLRSAIHFAKSELGFVTGLIGHSFGGAATLALTAEYSLSSDLPDTDPKVAITLAAPSDTQHLAALLERMNPEIETTGSGIVHIGGRPWRITREMLADFRVHDLPKLIGSIAKPTLLFHSPTDETVSYDHVLRIIGLIQNGGTNPYPPSLISLIGSDHLISNEPKTIDWIASSTAAFLQRFTNENQVIHSA